MSERKVNIRDNKYYNLFLKTPWPYYAGAVALAVLNISIFASSGSPWGVTSPFALWGTWIYEAFGGSVENWVYFAGSHGQALSKGFMANGGSIRNVGIIVGALLATLLASEFRIKKIKSWRQVLAAVIGGLLMGYGARIAFGCNIGALFSGVASMALSGWIYLVFMFLGAFVGSKLLVRFFM